MVRAADFPTISDHGVVTHVLVPLAVFERLTGERPGAIAPPSDADIDAAVAAMKNPKSEWHDAEGVLRRVVLDGVAAARARSAMSQAELGARVGLSQSQVSRIESNPEGASLGVLRRIAQALMDASGTE